MTGQLIVMMLDTLATDIIVMRMLTGFPLDRIANASW